MMENPVENTSQNRTGDNQNKKQEVKENSINAGTQLSALDLATQVIEKKKAEAKAKRGNGDFIDIEDGETKLIKFDVNKIKPVVRPINRKDGSKVQVDRIEYSGLIDINDPMAGEKRKDFAYKWAEMINAQLREGFRLLKITRTGSDMNDTNYTITPVNASHLEQQQ
jgi:hypothetical protein